jgi:hypothetical protein
MTLLKDICSSNFSFQKGKDALLEEIYKKSMANTMK